MTKRKKNKKTYVEYLNNIDVSYDMCWIGGKNIFHDRRCKYGSYLRKHDPIAFEVGYNEWVSNNF